MCIRDSPQSIMRNLTRLVHPEEKNSSNLIHSPRGRLGLNREDDYRLDKVPCGGHSRAADGKHFTSAIRHKNGDGCAQSILRRDRHALGHFLYQVILVQINSAVLSAAGKKKAE